MRTTAIRFHSTHCLPFESLFNANIRHQFSFYPLTSVSLPLRREQPPSVFILPFLFHLTPSSMRTTAISFHSTHCLPFESLSTRTSAISFHSTHCLPFESLFNANHRHQFSFYPLTSVSLPLRREQPLILPIDIR